MDGTRNSYRTHGNGREQAGMSREGRRTIEKVRENTVHDTGIDTLRLAVSSDLTAVAPFEIYCVKIRVV